MTEKVKCNTCDAMILPSTAERNGGLCMPCKQGNRESIESSKEFYRKQKEYDPFRELWTYLVDKVHSNDDNFYILSEEEQVYFAVGLLDGEVYNGGMHQFFGNSSGDLYDEVVNGLNTLGATNSLWLLRRATKVLFGNIKPSKDFYLRNNEMKQYPESDSAPTPDWSYELEKIDEEYWEDPDNISELLSNYAESSGLIKAFIKPKNQTQNQKV
ncbi:DMP19 family protein [Thalassotalea fusca]